MHKIESNPVIKDCFLDHPYALAGRIIDPVTGNVSWQGKTERLRRKELEVLALLASVGGAVVSRQAFIDVVWDGNALVGDHAVSNTISSLRHALHDSQAESQTAQPLVRTIPRRGYQLSELAQQPVVQASLQPALAAELPPTFAPGSAVPGCPGWRLVKRLGESAVSESWLAEPSEYGAEGDNTKRVFRFCRSEAYLRRLQREITLLRYVSQSLVGRSDIALIRDWQLDEPPYYLARDYAAHGSLVDWCAAGGLTALNWPQRVALMQAVAGALAAVHAVGVVHRHLRTGSILVDQSDAGVQLKISAFGTGALIDRRVLEPLKITAAGLTLGVEEAAVNTQTPADDVYALGVIFLQLALGDLQARDASALSRLENSKFASVLGTCLGSASARPTAAVLAEQLRNLGGASEVNTAPASIETTPAPIMPTAPASPLPQASAPTKAPGAPETIGNYHLLDRLGEGGMGTVYLAEQRAPVYRKVALKIIRSGLDGKQILSRFDAERQALAMMNHPNVAAVHESGMASDGRPFFAMEYIAGDDINSYCDAHHLNLQARVKLFLQVCDGVLHAHQKGVLHRDIKPSNLMVSAAPESAGTVKVIDFGLAKSLHGKLATHTLHTSFGAFIGTPVYSSPEHVSGSAAGVDTRSDIYSMGVVLYELLVGMTPIASESLENLEPEKVREIVCKSKLPSMREQLQNTSAEKRIALAEHRAIKVDELPKTLDGDLSWVVGKCLERDPNDRYASVLELRKDLERWLELRPVEARPTSAIYRFRKLIRRNRLNTAIVSGVAFALLATTSAALIANQRSKQALQSAEQAASFQAAQLEAIDPAVMGEQLRKNLLVALEQRKKIGAVDVGNLETLFNGVNFTDISLNQLDGSVLDPSLKAIREKFSSNSELQHKLVQALADTWYSLGRYEKAMGAQKWALELGENTFGHKDRRTLYALSKLALITWGLAGKDAAEPVFRKVIGLIRENLDERDPLRPHTLNEFAYMLAMHGKTDEAQALFQENLTHQKQFFPHNTAETSKSMDGLGMLLWKAGKTEEAKKLISEVLEGQKRVLGVNHKDTLSTMNHLSLVLLSEKNFPEAESYARQALKGYRNLVGELHPDTLKLHQHLMRTLALAGRLDEAEVQGRIAYNGRSIIFGEDHAETAQGLINFQVVLLGEGKLSEVESSMRGFLAIEDRIQNLPKDSHYAARLWLAIALQQQGKVFDAEALHREILSAEVLKTGAFRFVRSQSLSYLGLITAAKGDLAQSEVLQRQAYVELIEQPGEKEVMTLVVLSRLAEVLRSQGKVAEARQLGSKLIGLARTVLPPKHYVLGQLLTVNGRIFASEKLFADAEVCYQEARMILNSASFSDRALRIDLANAFIELYTDWKTTNLSADKKRLQWQEILTGLTAVQANEKLSFPLYR